MDDVLIQISQAGDVNGLYESIRKNPAVLKNIDEIMFEDTPLHIAASAGQTCFALEVMNLMPSFARKLNKDGLSPIHLALLGGHSELVLSLLRDDRELVRVKGRGRMTPLHYSAQRGNIKLLAVFLAACPSSVEDVTAESETVFHIAVRNDGIEALEVLVGWLKRVCHQDVFSWKTDILNWRNMQGNTVLDIAESNRRNQAIRLLTEINAKNSKKLKALGTTTYGRMTSLASYLRSQTDAEEEVAVFIMRRKMKISDDLRNALLMVAGLFVAANFQAVFSPPGGLRQDNICSPTFIINGTNYVNATATNTTDAGGSPSNDAGKTIMDARAFFFFFGFNGLFLFSLVTVIGVLLSDAFFGMMIMQVFLLTCYVFSIFAIAPSDSPVFVLTFVFILFLTIIVYGLLFYSFGKERIQQLQYNANKCPKEVLADETRRMIQT